MYPRADCRSCTGNDQIGHRIVATLTHSSICQHPFDGLTSALIEEVCWDFALTLIGTGSVRHRSMREDVCAEKGPARKLIENRKRIAVPKVGG